MEHSFDILYFFYSRKTYGRISLNINKRCFNLKKRKCKRFTIPGSTLHYKTKGFFPFKKSFPEEYYPVLDISKGGASFLTDQRIKPGSNLVIKLTIPELSSSFEILCKTKWIAKNREESYRYKMGIAFNTYGESRNQNKPEILELFNRLEENFTEM